MLSYVDSSGSNQPEPPMVFMVVSNVRSTRCLLVCLIRFNLELVENKKLICERLI